MPGTAAQLVSLAAAPISHTMPVSVESSVESNFLALPDAPAVCIFEAAGGKTLLLATTASARDLARRRFESDPAERTSRADLRAICAGGAIHAIRVGSSLEADAVYLHQARERLPHLAKVVSERWRAWFAHVDPEAEHPQWTKTNLMVGLVGKRSASTAIGGGTIPPGVILGPLPDKDAAGRFIESVTDCFDLCRYHNLLVQAPTATACAYKEMGRCPAPCDGSETMDRYRARVNAATTGVIGGVTLSIKRAEQAMLAAAAEEAFEKAAALQRAVARLKLLDKPAFSQVRMLHEWRELLVLPGPDRHRATLALFNRGMLHRVADVNGEDGPGTEAACKAAARALGAAGSASAREPVTLTTEQIETIGLVSRWLFLPRTKRKGEIVAFAGGAFRASAVTQAACSLRKSSAKNEPAIESHEIEETA